MAMWSDGGFVDENGNERRMSQSEIVEFLLFGSFTFTPKRYSMRIVSIRTVPAGMPTIIEIDEDF